MKAETIAYHEAGHAVMAWLLHVPIRRATIVAEEEAGSAGHVHHGKLNRRTREDIELSGGDPFSPSRLQAEKRVMISMAGEVAQRFFRPGSVRSHHSDSDRAYITDILTRYSWANEKGVIDCRLHYRLLQHWTERMLKAKWPLVKAVAAALLEHRTLSGKQIVEIIHKTIGFKPLTEEEVAAFFEPMADKETS
jgi:hypothetical protein